MIATTIEQSKRLLELGLDRKTADMWYSEKYGLQIGFGYLRTPAWSLGALLEVMPKPDLYRETADLWVCVAYFKEGTIRGFGETAIEAAYEMVCWLLTSGWKEKSKNEKGGQDESNVY